MDYIREYKSFINSHHVSDAVRITLGITLPAIVLGYFGELSAGIVVSLGAMCVANSDNPGPIHHRRNGMIACILILFAVTLLIGLASGSPWLLGIFVFLFCFVFSMMGIYGNRASAIGVNALLVMVLSIDRQEQGWTIFINALYVLAGGVWYSILSLLLYSFRPYKLTQQALGDCIQATADYLRIKASFYEKDVDYDRSYRRLVEEQVDVHEKQDLVRELLFKSRAVVKESTNTGRVLVMIFLDIVDLFERVMTSQQDYSALHRSFDDSDLLEKCRGLILDMATELDEIGLAIKSGRPSVETSFLSARIAEVKAYFSDYRDRRRTAKNVGDFIGLRQILESIEDISVRLHTLHGYSTYDLKLTKTPVPAQTIEDYDQFVTHQDIDRKLLLENLSLKSNIFRHSLRVSIATIIGYLISRFLPFGHGYWILLTVIVILKPAYSLTKRRNFERLAGTLAGALSGLLIIYFIKDRTLLFALMIFFMIGTYAFIRINYLVCVALMTPYVLLLFHLLYPVDFRTVISDRVIDTAIGSAIAFLANIFIVPSWEHEQIVSYMAKIIEDNLRYFRDVSGAFLGKPVSVTQYKLSRKHAFVSLANLSDAFSRMLSEPRSKQRDAGSMHQFVVSNHMLTSHIATLAYYAQQLPATKLAAPEYIPAVKVIGVRLENALKGLLHLPRTDVAAAGQGGLSPVAASREELKRLNQKVNTLMETRKEELNNAVTDSHTRRELSALKPIVDQFNFIDKVASDIEKLSAGVSYLNPAAPAASTPVPSS